MARRAAIWNDAEIPSASRWWCPQGGGSCPFCWIWASCWSVGCGAATNCGNCFSNSSRLAVPENRYEDRQAARGSDRQAAADISLVASANSGRR
jgi:hypothetical protein